MPKFRFKIHHLIFLAMPFILLFAVILALYARKASIPAPALFTAVPSAATPTQVATPHPPRTPLPSPVVTAVLPTPTSHQPPEAYLPVIDEWIQDAHDAQRTGYTHEEPAEPWTFLWAWNGPDENGATGGHFYDAPPGAHTVTGGELIFVPAGSEGLFALNQSDGSVAWHIEIDTFNATPAYHPGIGCLYAGSEGGILYQIDAVTGNVLQSYPAGGPLNTSTLLAGASVFVLTDSGELHHLQSYDLSPIWVYRSGAAAAVSPAHSASTGLIIFVTEDLTVHAVQEESGDALWQFQPPDPTSLSLALPNYWPVIAEQQGIVFVRYNLGMAGLWSGPDPKNRYPASIRETRLFLQENPHLKNLYALDLSNGEEVFTPATGFGGVETLVDGEPELTNGPVPVVRRLENGTEIAYLPFRSSAGDPPDGRWDSHLGEMVLDDHTVQGLSAGDIRFVQFENSYINITDEQCPLTMAGETIFHAHWGASESVRIVNRSSEVGMTYDHPIQTTALPVVIRRIQACQDFNPLTHWTSCGLTLFADGRYWNGPGWWVYWDALDPPTPERRAYSEGLLPRYTYVSNGLVIVEGNGGELMVFRHSSSSQAETP